MSFLGSFVLHFATIAGLDQVAGGGTQLRQKVKTMVADWQATIAAHKLQSEVAIATMGLDQAVDLWTEVMERRKEGKDAKAAVSTQVEEEKLKAEVVRENFKSLVSHKRIFEELEDASIDFAKESKDGRLELHGLREQRRRGPRSIAKESYLI